MRFQGRVLHVQIASDVKSLPPLRYSCRPLPSSCLFPGLDWATKSPISGVCLPATRNGEKGLKTELEKKKRPRDGNRQEAKRRGSANQDKALHIWPVFSSMMGPGKRRQDRGWKCCSGTKGVEMSKVFKKAICTIWISRPCLWDPFTKKEHG